MANRSRVPKFGNWESEDNVPYTVYFDKARKDRGGKMINPNDPQENPDMFPDIAPPAQAPPSKTRKEPAPIGHHGGSRLVPTHERRPSKEDGGDVRQLTDSPARTDNMGPGAATGSGRQRRGGHGSSTGRPVRQSIGSENSIERSPLHSHATPGRSRMKPSARGDDSPDKAAAVPRFGEWDENDPSSAENYTHIFNRVRVEKQTGSPQISGLNGDQSYNRPKQMADNNKGCCFFWSRK